MHSFTNDLAYLPLMLLLRPDLVDRLLTPTDIRRPPRDCLEDDVDRLEVVGIIDTLRFDLDFIDGLRL